MWNRGKKKRAGGWHLIIVYIYIYIYKVFLCFFNNILPILHWSIIFSLHVSSYGVGSVPTQQEDLI